MWPSDLVPRRFGGSALLWLGALGAVWLSAVAAIWWLGALVVGTGFVCCLPPRQEASARPSSRQKLTGQHHRAPLPGGVWAHPPPGAPIRVIWRPARSPRARALRNAQGLSHPAREPAAPWYWARGRVQSATGAYPQGSLSRSPVRASLWRPGGPVRQTAVSPGSATVSAAGRGRRRADGGRARGSLRFKLLPERVQHSQNSTTLTPFAARAQRSPTAHVADGALRPLLPSRPGRVGRPERRGPRAAIRRAPFESPKLRSNPRNSVRIPETPFVSG